MITREHVLAAQDRIAPYIRRTPTLEIDGAGSAVVLKLEHLQHTGCFKARGAFARILAARELGELDVAAGIVIASGGNAGLAAAHAARSLGVPATVFVPESAPNVKVTRIESYGARVVRMGSEYAQSAAAAVEHADRTGALLSHAYDQPEIVAGAGTIAEELLDDVPGIDTVVVAAGGGGLFAGVAASVHGRARVVVVEPETAPTLHAAMQAGAPVDVAVSGIAADALGARRVGTIAWDLLERTRPTSLLVDDDAIVEARLQLWERFRIAAEHGAACAYAALTSGAYVPVRGERVAVVVCGANTDTTTLVRP